MEFRIADTFADSLARLTAQEQKAVKTTAFDLQMHPSSPGLSFHKLDRAKDPNFWSVRVNADIRVIVHRTKSSLLLVYADHHDNAYKWAERRKIERHPSTGAMQLVEVRERVEEVTVRQEPSSSPVEGEAPKPKGRLFDNLRKFELMAFGVPADWVDPVRGATEDTLFEVMSHLPQEAQEALLKLAVGEKPEPAQSLPPETDPFKHPDAQRRFRIMTDLEELKRALEYPWEKWAVFLHPAQSALVEKNYSGPVRVSGLAGTGKTIVALHRAVHLARANPQARVLLTTFSKALASALKIKLVCLAGTEPNLLSRISVKAISDVGLYLYCQHFGQPNLATYALVEAMIQQAAANVQGHRYSLRFLLGEWTEVVDAWQLRSWEAYRGVSRLGRKTRVGGKQREVLWSIFERVQAGLKERNAVTLPAVFGRLADLLSRSSDLPFDLAVVDEAQDLGVAEARFLSIVAGNKPNGIFLAGDLGQRIFQQPFSLKAVGIDVRGRSFTLRINYRTSHQIRTHSDRLLPGSVSDVDGNTESRRGTISVFDGPPPRIVACANLEEERDIVAQWIIDRLRDGCLPHQIGVFVRSEAQLSRAKEATALAGVPATDLTDDIEVPEGQVALGTMHLAKGLEFHSVAVMGCDDEVLPLQERIASIADDADLEEVYNTERHLLYVACTRARDNLLVTGVKPVSEFLDDFLKNVL